MTKRHPVWNSLTAAGLASGPLPETTGRDTPWYIRTLLSVSAWIAAGFFLAFFGILFASLFDYWPLTLGLGLILSGAAFFLYALRWQPDFTNQFGLAIGSAGTVLVAAGLAEIANEEWLAALLFMLFQIGQFGLHSKFLPKLLTAIAAAFSFYVILIDFNLEYLSAFLFAAAALMTWLLEFRWPSRARTVRIVAWAFSLAAIATLIMALYDNNGPGPWGKSWFHEGLPLISYGVLLTAILASLWHIYRCRDFHLQGLPPFWLCVAAGLLFIITIAAPGVGFCAALIIIGFAHGQRLLTALAIFAMVIYGGCYYYSLEMSLLTKSLWMMGPGLALIVMAYVLHRFTPETET